MSAFDPTQTSRIATSFAPTAPVQLINGPIRFSTSMRHLLGLVCEVNVIGSGPPVIHGVMGLRGDLIVLSEGDRVPTDVLLLQVYV